MAFSFFSLSLLSFSLVIGFTSLLKYLSSYKKSSFFFSTLVDFTYLSTNTLVAPQPEEIESAELRRFDFDIQSPKKPLEGKNEVSSAIMGGKEGSTSALRILLLLQATLPDL